MQRTHVLGWVLEHYFLLFKPSVGREAAPVGHSVSHDALGRYVPMAVSDRSSRWQFSMAVSNARLRWLCSGAHSLSYGSFRWGTLLAYTARCVMVVRTRASADASCTSSSSSSFATGSCKATTDPNPTTFPAFCSSRNGLLNNPKICRT